MLIELDNVSKSYGRVRALHNLTATIRGNVIGLLGPNGAGKSTLLKAMLGLTAFEGKAKVLGMSPQTDSFRIRDKVGYMPEIDAYLAGMSAVSLCSYAAELSGLPRDEAIQRAHAALYYAGIEDKRYQPVESYSTGLKQRVKLAQALVHDPELLFLDEPTNGLDPKSRDEMLLLISDLPQRRGCTIIISTHLLPDVERICDQVVILADGHLRFSGDVAELKGQATDADRFAVEVKGDSERFAASLSGLGCEVSAGKRRGILVQPPPGQGADLIFRAARDSGVQIRNFEIETESLEQAFLRIVEPDKSEVAR